jgi:hypothetical protein
MDSNSLRTLWSVDLGDLETQPTQQPTQQPTWMCGVGNFGTDSNCANLAVSNATDNDNATDVGLVGQGLAVVQAEEAEGWVGTGETGERGGGGRRTGRSSERWRSKEGERGRWDE